MLLLCSLVYLYLVIQMVTVWFIYRATKNPSVVDFSWSIGIMIAGGIYLTTQTLTARNIVILFLLIIWGTRLAGYIWLTRIRKHLVDKRYHMLSQHWKTPAQLGFLLHYQLQALFIFIVASVFIFAASSKNTSFTALDYVATVVVGLGILGESIADYQLQIFRRQSPGKVCDAGLWNYSRHPNYLFDWLTWCGFALFGITQNAGWLCVISPLLMYIIFTRLSCPLTEQGSIESRGQAYREYQQHTGMFFPRF